MTGAKSKKNGRPAVTRNGSAERMRRYRERKRQGVVCIVQVPIYQLDARLWLPAVCPGQG